MTVNQTGELKVAEAKRLLTDGVAACNVWYGENDYSFRPGLYGEPVLVNVRPLTPDDLREMEEERRYYDEKAARKAARNN